MPAAPSRATKWGRTLRQHPAECLDLTVRLGGNAYLFEFKVAERLDPGAALAQLQERRYADKYRAAGRAIHLIGVEVSAATRAIVAFETAPG